mgnify:CR=1 FL=1
MIRPRPGPRPCVADRFSIPSPRVRLPPFVRHPAALAAAAAASNGPKKRTRKVEVADFKVGDSVMVVNGPFSGVHATITEINANSQRLKALVEILGRETPVDLTFNQIAKV